jgi:hypothetical protein
MFWNLSTLRSFYGLAASGSETEYSNVAAFKNYVNTDEETDFKRIRERNFWISVEGTFESCHILAIYAPRALQR